MINLFVPLRILLFRASRLAVSRRPSIRHCLIVRALWFTAAVTALSFPASAQTNFAVLLSDGAWTWYNDPRALFHNGKLYFGYVRAGDGKTALSVFDIPSGRATNLWSSGFTQLDDHNNPGLLVKQDGKLLAIYARHISDQYFAYRRSNTTKPVAPSDWAAEQIIPNSGAGMTYANPFQLSGEGGKIYNFCRNLNFNPTIYTSTDGGSNWSSPQWFIRTGTGSIRPYVKYCSDYTNRIDFLYTDGHPRDVANSLYHLYYQAGAFYSTDGTLVKDYAALPLLHENGERGSVIYQFSDAAQADPNQWIPSGRAWCWETAYQTNGAPVSVFTVQRDQVTGSNWSDDRIYYYYARWTGSNWQKRFIAHAGRPLYSAEDDYAGGICVDPVDPNVVYISSNAENPFNIGDTTNVPLSANQRYELWRGVTGDGGLTFTWSQVTSNSAKDNLRPYVPRRNGGEPCVIWFRGTYGTYSSYSCEIVGLFTTASAPPPPQPIITYVDASSGAGGNTALASGSPFMPPGNGTTGADDNWEERTPFGAGGNIFESGGENVAEDAPELRTRLSGLTPGAFYSVYAYFWDPSSTTEDWNLRAGFNSNPGLNTLFSAADSAAELGGATAAILASTLEYASAPAVFVESGRNLLAAPLGTTAADSNGEIMVFVDDLPTSMNVNRRTWYDGVGYARLMATNPPSISALSSNGQFVLSWPAAHQGWILQSQTSAVNGFDPANTAWVDVAGSSGVTSAAAPILLNTPAVFFRLRSP